jgi:tRNA-2-methylthio-N6-dimethylallyladenosine synthase
VRKTGVDRVMSFTKNFIKEGKKVIVSGCILKDDSKIFKDKGATLWGGENFDRLKSILNIKPELPLLRQGYGRQATPNSQLQTNLVPIMKGCNNFCSYCAVPYTRGREISRSAEEIVNDVKKVIESGNKEVILLGQNVNSYKAPLSVIPVQTGILRSPGISLTNIAGPEDDEQFGFAELLRIINDIPGDFVIKFTSNHPKDMSEDIIEAIASLPRVAKEIHLPLQSGSNNILKMMNRPYTREQYIELVDKIIARIPDVKISTDTIVGFPGETEEDFQQTVDIFEKVKFYQAFNNKYSPRSGTKAFPLGNPISWEEKQRRWRILNDLSFVKK